MREDAIVIEPHRAGWADDFTSRLGPLTDVIGRLLTRPIEHIGSTAVPGLPAKPIIDMLAVVPDHAAVPAVLPRLRAIGWLPAPEPEDAARRTWSFCLPSIEHRTHHLHVVEERSIGWPDWLLFRDYLRAHPDAAARYAALKQRLAAVDDRDRVRYRSGKAPLIAELLAAARVWAAA